MKEVYLSVYESDITYRFRNFRFYFSSRSRQERFIKGATIYVEDEKMKFRNKYRVPINDETFEEMFGEMIAGCNGSITSGLTALATTIGAAILLLKKKED